MDCYDTALRYANVSLTNQLLEHNYNKKKLAEMITEIKAQLLTWRLGVLRNEGPLQPLKSLWLKET
jgi:glutaryl-CoA dehydrogenase